jgi:2-dehydropantoate 2-reductase
MNIVVVGQGAIGLLFYHFISRTINSDKKSDDLVTLSPSYTTSNKQENYHFTDINGLTETLILNYANQNTIKTADIILLAVKSYQVTQALTQLASLLPSKAAIVLCHNGMGTFEKLPKKLTDNHQIISMLTTHGCLKDAPLKITHTGVGRIDFGIVANQLIKQQPGLSISAQVIVTKIKKLLTPANFHFDIIEKQWLKLAVNCVINPLTAIYDVKNGAINERKYKSITRALLAEIVLVAKTQDINLELNSLVNMVKKVAQSTSENSSSMRCDLIDNKPTEIDFINGYIHRLGQIHDINTPKNTYLWHQISQRQST